MVRHAHQNGKPRFPNQSVRALLVASGMSFRALAREVGCSEALVRRVVRGTRPDRKGKSAEIRRRLEALFLPDSPQPASRENAGVKGEEEKRE